MNSLLACLRITAFATACLVPLAAVGQSRPPPLRPSAPQERLALFEGEWTIVPSDVAESFKESCAWLPEGRRHMVCRSRWLSDGQPREGLSVLSYDAAAGEYTYHGFRAGGGIVVQRGSFDGDVLRLGSDRGQGESRQRISISIEPTTYGFTFVELISVGEGPWQERIRVEYRRMKPGGS